MKKNILYYMILCVLGLPACQNFLEPKSQSEFVPETVQSLDEMLIGEVYMGPEGNGFYTILGLFDDDVTCASELRYDAAYETDVERARLAFTWDKDMLDQLANYDLMYSTMYKRIAGCNAVLDFIDDVSGKDEQKSYVKAQALTMRAFYYLHLVNLYGKPYSYDKQALGVPLKLTSELKTAGVPRSTVEAVYQQIVADLSEAESLFKEVPVPGKGWDNVRRVTPAMVDILLSRTYLYMEEWKKAAEYGEKVIRDYSFRLYDLNTIPDPVKQFGNYPELCTSDNPEVIFQFTSRADAVEMGNLQMTWSEELNGRKVYKWGYVTKASDELIACYDKTPGDLRKKIYLIWTDRAMTAYYPMSKCGANNFRIDVGYTQWGAVLKLSEAYLNAAEGAAMAFLKEGAASSRATAIELVNTLREQRFSGDDFVALTESNFSDAETLVQFIRDERRRELCFEHHRWFDLRRYGMEPITHVWNPKEGNPVAYTLEKNDPGFTLLIPQGAFDLNSRLIQNERRGN